MSMQTEYERRLAVWSDIQAHLPVLYDTVRKYRDPVVIELGVRTGNSTAAFLAAGARLVSVDLRQPEVDWPEAATWGMIVGDDMNPEIISTVRAFGPADVLFIDTSHAYYHTLRELETYVPMVRPGGTVLLHDTEIIPPLEETGGIPQPPLPVMKAMAEYCAEHKLPWTNRTGCYGLGVISIPGG